MITVLSQSFYVGPVTRSRGSGRREGARYGARQKERPQLALRIARARAGTPVFSGEKRSRLGRGDDRQTPDGGEPVSAEIRSRTFVCVYEVPGERSCE